jgi:two-component system, sensor histidine kinase and response regulator
MKQLSRIRHLVGILVPLFVLASVGYIIYLVYAQYQAQGMLQQANFARYRQESEKKALSFGYYLSERLHDLSTLAESRDLASYFENQALGMSIEYGLGASIDAVSEMLKRFRDKRTIGEEKIFSRLVYHDQTGRILFDSQAGTDSRGHPAHAGCPSGPGVKSPEILFERSGPAGNIVMTHPVYFKGRYNGHMTGWIPIGPVYRHFIETDRDTGRHFSLMVFRDSYIQFPTRLDKGFPLTRLPAPTRITPGTIYTSSISLNGTVKRVDAFTTPVPNTPFAMTSFNVINPEEAGTPPHRLLLALVFTGLALFGGAIALIRIKMHSAVLEARLEETRLRERIVEEKNASLRKLHTAVEQCSNSIIIAATDGTIEYVNPYFCRTTGYGADEVNGKNTRILRNENDTEEKFRELWKTVLCGRRWSGELLRRKKNGEVYWEQANIAPVIDDNGAIVNLIAISEDITERKRAEIELRTAKETAEAASKAKSSFLANMSHEIRTPMNGIIGMTQLCLTTDLNQEQRSFLDAVKSSADNLLTIINDILDFSKIEVGRIELDTTPFLLRTTIGQTLRPFAAKAAEKKIELVFSPTPETPDALIGDPGRLKQILVNLVGNAVKFSDGGQILVSVGLAEEDETGCLLSFSVKDEGIGICGDKRETIFVPFEQGDLSTTKQYGGTGLGLSISKKLVELLGGDISFESTPGKGSIFTFTAHFEIQKILPAAHAGISLAGRRTLIVDDTPVNRAVLADYLVQWGMIADQAGGAAEAMEFLETNALQSVIPDFVLIDVQMPVQDGWRLASEIRSRSLFDSVRCIMMPSVGMRGDSQRCRELRIDGYLAKPVVHGELHGLLSMLISPSGSPAGPETIPLTRHTVNEHRERLSILVAEDDPVNQMVIKTILARYGHSAVMAANGMEAVRAWQDRTASFDLVLMDVQMPVMDGLEATARIRQLEAGSGFHVPIAAITAYARSEERDRCMKAGMDDFVGKPFQPEDVASLIERLTAQSKDVAPVDDRKEYILPPSKPNTGNNGMEAFNRTALLDRLGGRTGLLPEFIRMFIKTVDENLPYLEQAILVKDLQKAGKLVHNLKGISGTIGADRMHAVSKELEARTRAGDINGVSEGVEDLVKSYEMFKSVAGNGSAVP